MILGGQEEAEEGWEEGAEVSGDVENTWCAGESGGCSPGS